MSENFEIVARDPDDTFTQTDADFVCDRFVCAVCHARLLQWFIPGSPRVIVFCIEHGSITRCGRVTHATVMIEMEYQHTSYPRVIRNLPDLWGELIPPDRTREQNLSELGF